MKMENPAILWTASGGTLGTTNATTFYDDTVVKAKVKPPEDEPEWLRKKRLANAAFMD